MSKSVREQLMDNALVLLRESGPSGFTMAQLSRMTNVSVAAPYKHFVDREALLLALAVQGARIRRDRFLAALASHEDPREKLVALAVEIVRYAADERGFFDLALVPGLSRENSSEITQLNFEVFEAVTAAARPLISNDQQRFEFIMRLTAAAHGVAIFHGAGIFGGSTRAEVEAQASRSARALIDDAIALSSEGNRWVPSGLTSGFSAATSDLGVVPEPRA